MKYCLWNDDGSRVAVITIQGITVLSSDLRILTVLSEKLRVKDACWHDWGVLLYTTLSQLKYILPQSGEGGVVRSLVEPVYVMGVRGNAVSGMNREGKGVTMRIDTTEFMLKVSWNENEFNENENENEKIADYYGQTYFACSFANTHSNHSNFLITSTIWSPNNTVRQFISFDTPMLTASHSFGTSHRTGIKILLCTL